MTKVYKNIMFNVDQLAISITALEDIVKNENESINFYFEKLNGSDSTKDVRSYTKSIKTSKDRIKSLDNLIKQMASNEFITKHQL